MVCVSKWLLVSAFALSAVAAYADVKTGVDAYNNGDYTKAVNIWRPSAIAGDADAQYDLGQAYKFGRGVPQDNAQALDWYHRAASHNTPYPEAEDAYALMLFQVGKRQEAIPYLEKSAARGNPAAQYILGTAYFNGDLVAKDPIKAYAFMTRASASGALPKASEALATMDNYIPIDQRQQGLAMARQMELSAQSQQLALLDPHSGMNNTAPTPLRTEDVPPSTPAQSSYAPPPETPPSDAAPGVSYPVAGVETSRPAPPKLVPSKPLPTVRPRPVRPAPPVATPSIDVSSAPSTTAEAGGKWRVQLGAFSDQAKARSYGDTTLAHKAALDGMSFYLIKAGAIVRLQAGPLGSRAAAEKVCTSLKAEGQACLVVAP